MKYFKDILSYNVNGLLFRINDPEDLYNKTRLIIDNPNYIEKLSLNIARVKTIKENAKELEKLYALLIG